MTAVRTQGDPSIDLRRSRGVLALNLEDASVAGSRRAIALVIGTYVLLSGGVAGGLIDGSHPGERIAASPKIWAPDASDSDTGKCPYPAPAGKT